MAKRGRKAGNVIGRTGRKLPRTAPGPLTPNGASGRNGHREAVEQVTAGLRRLKAVELYVYQRLTMQQIAHTLSTNHGIETTAKTVCLDLHRAFEETNAQSIRVIAHGQEQEAMRLDQSDRQLLPIAMGHIVPDRAVAGTGTSRRVVTTPISAVNLTRLRLEALAQLRRNSESRRKLFGWDAQADEGVIPVEQVAAMMRGLVADILTLVEDNVDLRRQIAAAMRRRFGVLAAPETTTEVKDNVSKEKGPARTTEAIHGHK